MQLENLQIGDFISQDILGKNYKAHRPKSGKAITVKILHSSYLRIPHFIQVFQANAAAAGKLENENLLKMIASGSQSQSAFIISEPTDLLPLEKVLSDKGTLSIFDATSLIQKIATAIRSVHIDGLVHSALSPQTIFTDQNLEQIQIINWGFQDLFRLLISFQVKELQPALQYFSPEMVSTNTPIERQSDIYSIGVLYYRFLTGNTPWPETGAAGIGPNGPRPPVIPPSLKRLEIPDLLDTVILDTLEADTTKRCPNLSMFIKRIKDAKSDLLASFTPMSAIIYETGSSEKPQPLPASEPDIHAAIPPEKSPPDVPSSAVLSPANLAPSGENKIVGAYMDMATPVASAQSVADDSTTNKALAQETGRSQTPIDYKQQLLAHESDFFVDFSDPGFTKKPVETDKKPTRKITGKALNGHKLSETRANEAANFDLNTIEGQDTNGEKKQLVPDFAPQSAPSAQDEIKVTQTNDQHSSITGVKTESGSKRPFVNLNAIEFDDCIAATRYLTPSLGLTPSTPSRSGRTPPHNNAHTKNQVRQNLEFPLPGPQKAYSGNAVYFEDDEDLYDQTSSQTHDFATTHTVDIDKLNSKNRSFLWFFKVALLTVLPIATIYLALAYAFDLDLNFKNNRIWQRLAGGGKTIAPINSNESFSNQESFTTRQQRIRRPQRSVNSITNQRDQTIQSGRRNVAISNKGRFRQSTGNPRRQTSNPPTQRRQQTSAPANSFNTRVQNQTRSQSLATDNLISLSDPDALEIDIFVESATIPLVANVFLDGRLYGSTNKRGRLSLPNLNKGQSYLMKIQKAGFKMWAREISFQTGGNQPLYVELQSDKRFTDLTPTHKTPAQTKPVIKRRSRPGGTKQSQRSVVNSQTRPKTSGQNAQNGFGTINIGLDNIERLSDAYIYVNGTLWNGQNYAAPARIELPAGTYLIEVRKDGYFSAPPSRSVYILNGETESVRFILTAQ